MREAREGPAGQALGDVGVKVDRTVPHLDQRRGGGHRLPDRRRLEERRNLRVAEGLCPRDAAVSDGGDGCGRDTELGHLPAHGVAVPGWLRRATQPRAVASPVRATHLMR